MSATKPTNRSSASLDSSAWSKVKSSIDNAVSYFNATHFHPFTKKADLEDLSQDIFIHVWERIDQFDPSKSSLQTWLSRVTHNYCVDKLKRSYDVSFVPFDDEMAHTFRASSSPEEEYIEMECIKSEDRRRQWLTRSINSLSPREREVMRLTLQGRKPRDIAQILNATPNSIRIAKFNAQRTLCDIKTLKLNH